MLESDWGEIVEVVFSRFCCGDCKILLCILGVFGDRKDEG